MIVVIPSNRAIHLHQFAPLIDSGCRFIVVDDTEGSITVPHPAFQVLSWQDRARLLGRHDIAIPRRNGACRDLGFLLAWKEADPDEIIIALDDDCHVPANNFAPSVELALSTAPRPTAHGDPRHLNILDLYNGVPDHLFPRGFPYTSRGGYQRCNFEPAGDPLQRPALFSLGLWQNIFDVNAIDKIHGPAFTHPDAELRHWSTLIAPGPYVSVCSMNMQFRRQVIPAVYQLPMHVPEMPHWVNDRYGDIWGGFILKLLMDINGDPMVAGSPMIRHLKEGNHQRNIWQEHICHLVNDEFIALLDQARPLLQPADYLALMAHLAEFLASRTAASSPLLRPYLEQLVPAMTSWVALLSP